MFLFIAYKSKKNTTMCCKVRKDYYLCTIKTYQSMKRLWLVLLCSLFCFLAQAESVIRGTVKDATKGSGVAYATVSATSNGVVACAVAADAAGAFELKVKEQGQYTVEISSVGYQPFTRSISAVGKPIDLGEVLLSEGVAVDAVAVTVQKPIVTADAEKLSYSVEDDPESKSSTLEDIIRKIPQLTIDAEGKVQMNGQSDFKILVNGRAAGAMGRNFNDIIKSMPASSIKKIEVITNPSMKYDAEGAGGVLNIITSKTRFDGYNGNVNLAGGNSFNRNYNGQLSGNFTVQKNKISLSAGIYLGGQQSDNDPAGIQHNVLSNINATAPYSTLDQTSKFGYSGGNLYTNLSFGYQIDTLNLLTLEASLWRGRWGMKANGESRYLDSSNNLLSGYTTEGEGANSWFGFDAMLAYEHTFKGKQGHTLTFSNYFSCDPPTENYNLERNLYQDGAVNIFRTDSRSKSVSNEFQADYNNRWGKHSLEAGVKHSFDHNTLTQLSSATDIEGTTTLVKNIAAIYGGYAFNHKSLTARAGARLEGAWYNSKSVMAQSEQYKSALINVVPYLSLSYKIKEGHNLSLSYSERLSRPGVNALSPYVTATATQLNYGNPDLKTGVNHLVRLKYAWMNNKWMVAPEFMMMLSNNRVANYTFVDSDGMLNTTYLNHGRNRGYALQTTLSYRPSQKFNLSADVRVGYFEDGIPSQNIMARGWAFSQSLNATIALWKGAKLTLNEYVAKFQPQQSGVSKNIYLSTTVRLGQKLLKDKMELSLSVQNPHAGKHEFHTLTTTPTYIQNAYYTAFARSIRIALSYRFGKQGLYVKRANRKSDSSTEEVGGSTQGGANNIN